MFQSPSIDLRNLPFENNLVYMQYTGLKDKNGKEIYESDLVKLFTNRTTEEVGFVFWDIDYAAFKWTHVFPEKAKVASHNFMGDGSIQPANYWLQHSEAQFREVIGNIYQDSHILDTGV